MTFDPTTNRSPFGLLSEDEQESLKKWSGGWEFYHASDWFSTVAPFWDTDTTYRGKPAPVVTSKWFNVYPVQWKYQTRPREYEIPYRGNTGPYRGNIREGCSGNKD